MTINSPISLVWHGSYGERRWILFLLSGLNIIQPEGALGSASGASVVIHAISTGNTGHPGYSDSLSLVQSDIRAGKKVGLIHLSDEWFRCDTSWYKGAAFVLKFYYCSFISHPAIKYLPLGYPEHCVTPDRLRPASERSLVWSFCGQRKYSRIEMLSSLANAQPNKCPQKYISPEEYQEMVNDTIFSPCPMGNTTPDTWRFYESLEAGCIPIAEKRWTVDYFGRIFPDSCPIPRFHSWTAAARWMQTTSDKHKLDRLQTEIQTWWTAQKDGLREQVSRFILERFNKHPEGSLLDWDPPYKGIFHKIRWMTELCRYTTPRSLLARGLKQLALTSIAKRKA